MPVFWKLSWFLCDVTGFMYICALRWGNAKRWCIPGSLVSEKIYIHCSMRLCLSPMNCYQSSKYLVLFLNWLCVSGPKTKPLALLHLTAQPQSTRDEYIFSIFYVDVEQVVKRSTKPAIETNHATFVSPSRWWKLWFAQHSQAEAQKTQEAQEETPWRPRGPGTGTRHGASASSAAAAQD